MSIKATPKKTDIFQFNSYWIIFLRLSDCALYKSIFRGIVRCRALVLASTSAPGFRAFPPYRVRSLLLIGAAILHISVGNFGSNAFCVKSHPLSAIPCIRPITHHYTTNIRHNRSYQTIKPNQYVLGWLSMPVPLHTHILRESLNIVGLSPKNTLIPASASLREITVTTFLRKS